MSYEKDIQNHLTTLVENLSNLDAVLISLLQKRIISKNEKEEIQLPNKTSIIRNEQLLSLLRKKDWPKIKNEFLGILRATQNNVCADIIERKLSTEEKLAATWWPVKKQLISALHKRKIGDQLLVENLHDTLISNRRRMTVICQSEKATKFSGLGGVGKTLTAKWYAHHYEKEYSRIMWIDCGEDSFLKSFKNLARYLNITNRDEIVELRDLARECYRALNRYKCLWIFDNAESYFGNDGVHTGLPESNEENFYCIITSRSRERWGNDNGFGEITKFELNVFDNNESIDFLRAHLKNQLSCTNYQLKRLSKLLGNLPLALQLAIAAINAGKMDLQDYIDKTTTIDAANIVNEQFDDYERTINTNIQISLEMIQKAKYGKLARHVFLIFGYIRPDDIQANFIRKVAKISFVSDLKSAVDLLEQYSLISKTGQYTCRPYNSFISRLASSFGWIKSEYTLDTLSIHRLLQQVIRHNGRSSEDVTIRKILNCKKYLEYKLVPYLFANEKVKIEFYHIRSLLVDQLYLQKLITEKRLAEAVDLSRFIDQELQNEASLYNYALCLDMKGEMEESLLNFIKLFHSIPSENCNEQDGFNCKINPFYSQPNYQIIKFHVVHLIQSKQSRHELSSNELEIIKACCGKFTLKLEGFNLNSCVNTLECCSVENYLLESDGTKDEVAININTADEIYGKKIKFTSTSREYQDLFARNFFDSTTTKAISFNVLVPIKCIQIEMGSLAMSTSTIKISPQELQLSNVTILNDHSKEAKFNLNKIVDFSCIQKLYLSVDNFTKDCTMLTINLSEPVIAKEVTFCNVEVLSWHEAKWTIQKLTLRNVNFKSKNHLNIRELDADSVVDIECLPGSLEILVLYKHISVVGKFANIDNNLKTNLKCLHLYDTSSPSEFLNLFSSFTNLKKLTVTVVNFIKIIITSVPQSISDVEIISKSSTTPIIFEGDAVRKLKTLRFDDVPILKIIDILKNFKPQFMLIRVQSILNSLEEMLLIMSSIDDQVETILILLVNKNGTEVCHQIESGVQRLITKKEFETVYLKIQSA